ncbi:hypothetical protein EQM14_01605 [Caproiciproducens sp. NJN-50]|uniref:hypothetical protein n=1 Tax=Caproiciproducens sp. NJN-50 TaxID=2507162 RepID=UPI000FFDFB86|nr:hypothetical protein [Caproiciproducens sp. NJN-50]QAT48579.1 hypothetical protein EQM14_01605 [Caproiciproducens sp. NJN-50]
MTNKTFFDGHSEKTYTQEELKDAINKATCEAYERAKTESEKIRTKYNALLCILRGLDDAFGDGDL